MRGVPQVPVSINGHETNMIVDTGAWRSAIWRSAAASFGLQVVSADALPMGGVEAATVRVRDFSLAGYAVHGLDLYAIGGSEPGSTAGFLGEDLLSRMDVEFDLGGNTIRMFAPQGCEGGQVVYWANSYSMLPLLHASTGSNWLAGEVSVNGQAAVAMFDSGASTSFVTTNAVKRPGMSAQTMAGTEDRPIAIFDTLTVGQEDIRHAQLRVADIWGASRGTHVGSLIPRSPFSREPDLLIGADFFQAHRIYIARSQGKLYFTYSGGPIFRPAAQGVRPADNP